MKYYLKTTYPCIIKTQNESVYLDENDTLEVENEKQLFVYPENSYQTPFCVNLLYKQDCSLFSFVKVRNENYIILENQNFVYINQKEKLSVNGKTCQILVGKNFISFEGDKKIIKQKNINSYNQYTTFSSGNFACVQFKTDFYAFDAFKEKLYHFSGKNITFENNTLYIFKNENSQKISVKLDKEIKITAEFDKKTEFEFNFLPQYQFLLDLKDKNFQKCFESFSTSMKEKITTEKLQKFFGNFSTVLPLNNNEYIVYSTNNKKYVTFEIEDDKICDINVDEL